MRSVEAESSVPFTLVISRVGMKTQVFAFPPFQTRVCALLQAKKNPEILTCVGLPDF